MKNLSGALCLFVAQTIVFCASAQAQMDIESVNPSSGEAGSDLGITITGGVDCNFNAYSLELSFNPATNITHDDLTPIEYNVLSTTIHIPQDTAPGAQTVTVTANGMDCTGDGVFEVTCTNCSSASITSISPDSGSLGSNLSVSITGEGTHFDESSTVEFEGGGIQVNTITPNSDTSLDADISIAPDAAVGTRTVTVTTGGEVAKGEDLFQVEQIPIDLSPSEGDQGQTISSVTISGGNAGYSATSAVDLGEGIQIGSFSSPSDDTLILSDVQILDNAPIGPHTLVVTVSGQRYSYAGVFDVLQGANTLLLSVSPDHGDRGHPGLDISLVGQNTHFDEPDVGVTFSGSSVMASAGAASDPTHLTATMVIGDSAAEDVRDVTVKVGCANQPCEIVSLSKAFTITDPSTLDSAQPSHIEAGQTLQVDFTSSDGQFEQDITRLVFDSAEGIQVQDISVTDANHLTATLLISDDAKGDPRDVKAVTNTEVAIGDQLIDIENPSIDSVSPSSSFQGLTGVDLTITGTDIPFDADTSIEFSKDGITVRSVAFDPEKPKQLVATIDISPTASIGHRTLTISTTAGITASAEGIFNILARASGKQQGGGCNCSSHGGTYGGLSALLLLLGLLFSFSRRR